MLTNWLKGGKQDGADKTEENEQPTSRRTRLLEADPEIRSDSSETDTQKQKRLAEALTRKSKPRLTPYDEVFRAATALLLERQDITDGLSLNVTRNVHNTLLTSKWCFANPQATHYEVGLGMNGFSEMLNATYSTLSRWTLMYQKQFTTGALVVAQMMAQPSMAAMGAPPSTFFGLACLPIVPNGCTSIQYVKGHQLTLAHLQGIMRGFSVGAQMVYDITIRDSTMTYLFHSNRKESVEFAGEVKPTSGEWKLAAVRHDWATDVEVCAQLECTEKRHGLISIMSLGMKKDLLGGGSVQSVLSGFSKVKLSLDIPFGGQRAGFNAAQLGYNAMYDIVQGGLKQGVTLTY